MPAAADGAETGDCRGDGSQDEEWKRLSERLGKPRWLPGFRDACGLPWLGWFGLGRHGELWEAWLRFRSLGHRSSALLEGIHQGDQSHQDHGKRSNHQPSQQPSVPLQPSPRPTYQE